MNKMPLREGDDRENEKLLSRFRGAMIGSALGDAIGERRGHRAAIANTASMKEPWAEGVLRYTDDTAMAIGLAECLVCKHEIHETSLGDLFVHHFFREPWRGYAGGPPTIFAQAWRTKRRDYYAIAREVGEALFPGGSWGNGAAMRIAPLVYFWDCDNLYDKVDAQARITHTHPIAIDGAAVLTKAVALATSADSADSFDARGFCDELIRFSRNDIIRAKLLQANACLANGTQPAEAARLLGQTVATHESVPFALYSFLRHPASFTDCLLCATGNGGDMDTVGAMACAVSGAYLGIERIPPDWRTRLENVNSIELLATWLWQVRMGGGPDGERLFSQLVRDAEELETLPGEE